MAGLPHMPLFVKDYLIDTVALSIEESGAYLHLLMHAWTRGGELPDDNRQLAAMCKVGAKKWATLRPVLEPFWQVGDGRWANKRLSQELQFVRGKSEKRSSAGAKGGKAKANKSNDIALAKQDFAVAPTPTPTPTQEGREEGSARTPEIEPLKSLSDEVPTDHHDTLRIAQECARAGGVRFIDPGHIGAGVNLIREWQQAGADPPLMLQAIRDVLATTKQQRIGSLNFFDGAVRRAIAQQEAQRHGHIPKRAGNAEPSFSELAMAQLLELRSGEAPDLGGGGHDARLRLGHDAG